MLSGACRRAGLVGLLAAVLVSGVRADDASTPERTPGGAARKVVEAVGRGDADALANLASRDYPDPWLVAEELLASERGVAAAAFAEAAKRPDTARLSEYVSRARDRSADPTRREAIAEARRAVKGADAARALAALDRVEHAAEDILAVLAGRLRGEALRLDRRHADSGQVLEATARAARTIGWLAAAARAFEVAGASFAEVADRHAAARVLTEALALYEQRADRHGQARVLGSLGHTRLRLGDFEAALAYEERALALWTELADAAGKAATWTRMGAVHEARGDLAQATTYYERALAAQRGLAASGSGGLVAALTTLGRVCGRLGDAERSRRLVEEALRVAEAGGRSAEVATATALLGALAQADDGDAPAATAHLQRALELARAEGDPDGEARALHGLGRLAHARRDFEEALKRHERALELRESIGDRAGLAFESVRIGLAHQGRGDARRALDALKRAREGAEAVGDRRTLVHALWAAARVFLAADRPRRALALARRAADESVLLVEGHAEEHGAAVRERFDGLFEVGMRAAVRLRDPKAFYAFLERGRAGTLLESLGGRDRLQAARLPPELHRAEARARTAETDARERLAVATRSGQRDRVSAARRTLEDATNARRAVLERIQREAKAAAHLLYPRADALGDARARLGPGAAFVFYELLSDVAVALVLTSDTARLVRLGDRQTVLDRVRSLRRDGPPWIDVEQVEATRATLMDPLDLPASVTRLYVSPAGDLATLPFALLAPARVFVYVPSGTAHRMLAEDARCRGRRVLALGDPVYDARGPDRLGPLPATRAEAEAVGDAVLLGDAATEAGFRALVETEARWRAVHFACHGLVDLKRPMLSALVLTPGEGEDGRLTALEILRLRVPADLVLLSACETGRGRTYEGEGLVGLARSFMYAGSPRVIVSLWPVADDATRALMTRFYERWKPDPTGAPPDAAAALREAQNHVRSQPRWSHPQYWAAWVLWGVS